MHLQGKLVQNYVAGMSLTVTGNDDIWLFVNGQRVIDLGGIHVPEVTSSLAAALAPYLARSVHVIAATRVAKLAQTNNTQA